jgi:hypothetical protein
MSRKQPRSEGQHLRDFVGKKRGDSSDDIGGLCRFLKEIITEEGSDDSLMNMAEEFYKHTGRYEDGEYVWKKNPPSDLFYGIFLAAIEDEEIRKELQEQIESRSYDELMEEMNAYKAEGSTDHKEAFLNLKIVKGAEREEAIALVPDSRPERIIDVRPIFAIPKREK